MIFPLIAIASPAVPDNPPSEGSALLCQVITATPRQLESLIRLSEALARMKLSETVR